MAQRQWRSDDTSLWTYGFGNGSDGDLTISSDTTDAPIDASCSGAASATSLSATNVSFAGGQLILIHQTRGTGVGAWELNRIESYTAGTITTTLPLINTYIDSGASQAQVLVLKQYNNVTINSGKTLSAKAWNENVGGILAFFAKGVVTVTGTLNIKGANAPSGYTNPGIGIGFRGGIGKGPSGSGVGGTAYTGEGTANTSLNQQSPNGNGGGGAYVQNAEFSNSGGGGGANGTNGNNGWSEGSATGGAAGTAVGNVALTLMDFGGGGGGGASDGSADHGAGGGGGGIACIFAANLTITGAITLNGGNGYAGYTGGGGAAGGSCLLKVITATLGTNLITAAAGAGGDSAHSDGGTGAVGRVHIDYSGSYTGTSSPTINATNDPTIVQVSTGTLINYAFFM